MTIDTEFSTPHGQYRLHRLPRRHHPSLRAWDAADDYLIRTLSDTAETTGNTLVLNDDFGALCLGLLPHRPVLWFDSAVEADALARNLADNDLPSVPTVPQTQPPPTQDVTRVVMKIPRNSALLAWQLAMLNRHLPEGIPVWLGGMLKHVTAADQAVMADYLADVSHSRIVRKARYWAGVSTDRSRLPPTEQWSVPDAGLNLENRPGVFSARRLDPGAACLLRHLPAIHNLVSADLPERADILDLCCGNGVLGLSWQQLHSGHSVQFSDASAAAVTSTRINWQLAGHGSEPDQSTHCAVHHQDGLSNTTELRCDLILCNPPFHQADTITTDVARALFRQAGQALQSRGWLIVVANRHLGYHQLLKASFRQVSVLSGERRFVVLAATQPK